MKYDFWKQVESDNIDLSKYSDTTINKLESYCNKRNINVFELLSTKKKYTENEIIDFCDRVLLNDIVQLVYDNIGPKPLKRLYKFSNCEYYIKVLHYFISRIYGYATDKKMKKKKKDKELFDNPSSRKIAIHTCILSEDESDPDVIESKVKKVDDAVAHLEKKLHLITREQIHNPGRRGSFRKVRIDWENVIQYLEVNDFDKEDATIVERKIIRKRIITFISRNMTKKQFQELYSKFFKKQAATYLINVICFEPEKFKENKRMVFNILGSLKYLKVSKRDLNTKNIVPELIPYGEASPTLTLRIKSDRMYKDFVYCLQWLTEDFKDKYNIDLEIEPDFSFKNSPIYNF